MSAMLLNASVSKQTLIRRAGSLAFVGAKTVEALGRYTARYGLVLALFWIGGMKFTSYEAEGISGFVSNSPLMSWAYSVFSVQNFSALLGVMEIAIALLIASRPFSARGAVVGSGLAVGMFLTTLTSNRSRTSSRHTLTATAASTRPTTSCGAKIPIPSAAVLATTPGKPTSAGPAAVARALPRLFQSRQPQCFYLRLPAYVANWRGK